jgi:hypothetical protein
VRSLRGGGGVMGRMPRIGLASVALFLALDQLVK